MNRELIIFPKDQYSNLRKEYEEKGYKIFSFSRTSSSDNLYKLMSDNEKVVIDISAIGLLNSDNGLIYNVEQLLLSFPDDTVFISDINDEDYKYKLRYCFESYIYYETKNSVDTNNELEPELDSTFIKKVINLNQSELEDFFGDFNKYLYGHAKFKEEFKSLIDSFRVFNGIGEHKILSIFLMGDSGVGKTEVARSIHKCLGSKKRLAKINFGNYSSQDSLNSLIGSPRGYIGSDGGELFDRVLESDIGLILIDEFEKANAPVFNYFLDILETGKAVNSMGEEINLDGYIIIFTSNVKRENFNNVFSPELRSRFDYKGYFKLLTTEDKVKYTQFRLNQVIKKYNMKHGTKLNKSTHANLMSNMDVSKYQNMRLLNSRIKEVFVQFLKNSGRI